MRRLAWTWIPLSLVALGCDQREPPPPPPPRDAGQGMDAGGLDATIGPRRDAGPPPGIDGVLEDREWAGAQAAMANVPTDAPGSELRRLLTRIEGDALLVGVDLSLAAGDSLVVYVDRATGEPDGVGDLSTLDDTDVALDAALSGGPATPSSFRADVAFGADALPRRVVGLDPAAGWRSLDDPMALTWIEGEVGLLVCTDSACEASLPLDTLGGAAPRTIAMFARIVRGTGGWTNQTLPADDAMNAGVVMQVLTVEEAAEVDAGAPDAGTMDAGTSSIVVDGMLSAGEWSAATLFTQTATASGPFVGNRLDTLRALRRDGRLYVAVETTLLTGNALVLYLDHDLNGVDGLTSPTPLVDTTGELDRAIARTLFTPAELRIDYAWGTLDLGRTAGASDSRMGWREVATRPDNFTAIDGTRAPTVCGASVCETSIALVDLAVDAADSVALFARLVSATSAAISNQTLPVDDPGAPDFVSVYAQLDP